MISLAGQTYHMACILCIHLFISNLTTSHSFPEGIKLEKNETQSINQDREQVHQNVTRLFSECGKLYTQAQQNTTSESIAGAIGASPWHVTIFNKNKLPTCGGTIISETVVLSAVHCFFNNQNECKENSCVKDFEVVIGKYTSDYTIKDTSYQRSMQIKEIRFSKTHYLGENGFYAFDLAVLILKEKIPISPAILPACLNLENLKNEVYPSEGELGKIMSWSRTENSTYSYVLRNITLPFSSNKRCWTLAHKDFRHFITFDKFCAGSGNETGDTLGDGDAGSGLLFKKEDLYYLQGVASTKQYSANSLITFTDLSKHIRLISSVLQEEKEAQNAAFLSQFSH